jgi:hypothetical protein
MYEIAFPKDTADGPVTKQHSIQDVPGFIMIPLPILSNVGITHGDSPW